MSFISICVFGARMWDAPLVIAPELSQLEVTMTTTGHHHCMVFTEYLDVSCSIDALSREGKGGGICYLMSRQILLPTVHMTSVVAQ